MPEDGKRKKFQFFYFQGEQKPPSKHPYSTIELRDKILGPQTSIVELFKQQETQNLHKKPRVRENVDNELLEMRSKSTAEATQIIFNYYLVIQRYLHCGANTHSQWQRRPLPSWMSFEIIGSMMMMMMMLCMSMCHRRL